FRGCRSTASVRTGPAHFRTRGGCSYSAVVPWEDEHQLVRNAGCSAPALRHMHPERSGFVRVGAPPRCERGQHLSASGRAFSHPGRVLLQRGDALGGTSTSSSAPRGVAHPRYANPRRNSHLGIEAFQLGCAFFFGFAALALDDHADRAPQGFASPLVAGAAEEAGVEVVEGFFELQVVVAQADQPFAVLLSGPELQRLAGFGGA